MKSLTAATVCSLLIAMLVSDLTLYFQTWRDIYLGVFLNRGCFSSLQKASTDGDWFSQVRTSLLEKNAATFFVSSKSGTLTRRCDHQLQGRDCRQGFVYKPFFPGSSPPFHREAWPVKPAACWHVCSQRLGLTVWPRSEIYGQTRPNVSADFATVCKGQQAGWCHWLTNPSQASSCVCVTKCRQLQPTTSYCVCEVIVISSSSAWIIRHSIWSQPQQLIYNNQLFNSHCGEWCFLHSFVSWCQTLYKTVSCWTWVKCRQFNSGQGIGPFPQLLSFSFCFIFDLCLRIGWWRKENCPASEMIRRPDVKIPSYCKYNTHSSGAELFGCYNEDHDVGK